MFTMEDEVANAIAAIVLATAAAWLLMLVAPAFGLPHVNYMESTGAVACIVLLGQAVRL